MKKTVLSGILIVGLATISFTQETALQLHTKTVSMNKVTIVEQYNQAIAEKEQELNASKNSNRSAYMAIKNELDALQLEYIEVLQSEIELSSNSELIELYQKELLVMQQKTAN